MMRDPFTYFCAVYFTAAFLTFGYVGNRACLDVEGECEAFTIGYFSGAFWPLYWAGKGALYVTRPDSAKP